MICCDGKCCQNNLCIETRFCCNQKPLTEITETHHMPITPIYSVYDILHVCDEVSMMI